LPLFPSNETYFSSLLPLNFLPSLVSCVIWKPFKLGSAKWLLVIWIITTHQSLFCKTVLSFLTEDIFLWHIVLSYVCSRKAILFQIHDKILIMCVCYF
jgi:hypothetical protein